ncbi:hypothetical protein CDD81_5547 [Ophiocordyceps australis]|uniref:Uncharacterized protein n=1 Tax=Ophiocordyceps australis TaxID=1399860 RepID=A0A2C5XPW3_9HYPO|nr:hypothetical protein CDD81_5547 [Ophiocordyceps australis]
MPSSDKKSRGRPLTRESPSAPSNGKTVPRPQALEPVAEPMDVDPAPRGSKEPEGLKDQLTLALHTKPLTGAEASGGKKGIDNTEKLPEVPGKAAVPSTRKEQRQNKKELKAARRARAKPSKDYVYKACWRVRHRREDYKVHVEAHNAALEKTLYADGTYLCFKIPAGVKNPSTADVASVVLQAIEKGPKPTEIGPLSGDSWYVRFQSIQAAQDADGSVGTFGAKDFQINEDIQVTLSLYLTNGL